MRTERRVVMGAGMLAIATASMAFAQSAAAPGAQVLISSGGLASAQKQAQGEIVREIDDPHTGDRWLLMRSGQFPGGPGRLVLATAHRNTVGGASGGVAGQPEEAQSIPVIHIGDRLIVEEHTTIVDAVLEARALNPATAGAALEVRLTIGGSVVRVVALGPGRAALLNETGKRP
ncbi:MAG: hypothetical protein ABSE55_12520 [Terracidiphilus sp.]